MRAKSRIVKAAKINPYHLHLQKTKNEKWIEECAKMTKLHEKCVKYEKVERRVAAKDFEARAQKNTSLNCLDVHENEDDPVFGLELWGQDCKGKPEGEGWVMVKAVVDSGAGACVGPKSLAGKGKLRPSEGSKGGQRFTSASGGSLKNEGEVVLDTFTDSGQGLRAVFQIADITRPLLSVSKICEKGNLVYFGQGGWVIMHGARGQKTFFGRENGIYVLELYVRAEDVGF